MPIGIAGLVVAAILAAAMSNICAALNSLIIDHDGRLLPARQPAMDRSRAHPPLPHPHRCVGIVLLAARRAFADGGKGHVVEIGLSIASVTWGEMLGAFLLGTLTRRATQAGTILGMIIGLIVNLSLWLSSGAFPAIHVSWMPKVAFIWYVLIGALITTTLVILQACCCRNRKGPRPHDSPLPHRCTSPLPLPPGTAPLAAQNETAASTNQPPPAAYAPIDAIVNGAVAATSCPAQSS